MPENKAAVLANDPGYGMGETFGSCCSDSDCASRWGLRGASCGYEEYYGENVCISTEEKRAQASPSKEIPAPPIFEEFPAPPPAPEQPGYVTVPFTTYSFPWWYLILGTLIFILLAYALLRKTGKPQAKPRRKHKK